jgi:hypothetical protein
MLNHRFEVRWWGKSCVWLMAGKVAEELDTGERAFDLHAKPGGGDTVGLPAVAIWGCS